VLEPSSVARGKASSRTPVGDFELHAQTVVVTSGGIGGNHELVRQAWPARLGTAPEHMICGVPAHVDGRMIGITERTGANVINGDRMWHYVEGIHNWDPIWAMHGIRIIPGPSSVWLDATGERLPVPLFPGFDTLGTLAHLRQTGYDHSWFLCTRKIVEREFALSGSEQNPDLTNRSIGDLLARVRGGVPAPVQAFIDRGEDFVSAERLGDLVEGMNRITGGTPRVELERVEREVTARDREMANTFTKDMQVTAVRGSRSYLADRFVRTAAPHRLLDPKAGPLIAVRLSILTRKTLGGLQTDLDSRVLNGSGEVIPGLYAAGEIAGFGGGGMHGYRSLEGTFLGGCMFSGRAAGRHSARAIG
jgi:hypothetical protein